MATNRTVPTKLTAQQSYLLNRIPSRYDLADLPVEPEPAVVKKARKLIKQYDEQREKKQCEHRKRQEALIRKAKEAVYFDEPKKALAIVQQVEKMLKGCPV